MIIRINSLQYTRGLTARYFTLRAGDTFDYHTKNTEDTLALLAVNGDIIVLYSWRHIVEHRASLS